MFLEILILTTKLKKKIVTTPVSFTFTVLVINEALVAFL